MKKTLAVGALALCAIIAGAQAKFAWLDKDSDDADKVLPGVDPAKVQGDVVCSGSSTVFPLSEAITEQFKKDGYTGQVTLDSIGSGGGFERFGKGEIDIANASRAIKDGEKEKATAALGQVYAFRIGTDAIAVCVSNKNKFVKDLSLDQLALLFSTAENWSDVDPKFPKKPIKRYTPGTDSGTFDYFVEHVFAKKKEPLLGAKNLQMSEDDNVLVQGIEGSEYSVGFFGFAYYVENQKKLKALSLKSIAPSKATVDNGTYPLARPLFLYSAAKPLAEKPQVAAYLAYYLSNVNKLISKVGYFPAPAADLKASKELLLSVIKDKI